MSGPDDFPVPAGADDLLPASEADRVQLLAAALRADMADLGSYERVLAGAFGDSLPEGVLVVERQRSMGDRLAGRQGEVRAIRVTLGDERLDLERQSGRLIAFVTKNVRGVAISHREVTLDEWTAAFARALERFADQNARARAALQRLLGA
jgi:hypothetical protein